ncbi:MAG: M56 family metallopeptidase [Pirellulales bacterium]|nr:M56 family metallopeptidase [Pirellulales bacterium]
MSYPLVLEILASLIVQVAILVGMTSWIARRPRFAANADVCWSTMHVCVLLLTAAAFSLPHLRLVTWSDFGPARQHLRAVMAVDYVGWLATWAWLSGSVVILLACVAGICQTTYLVRRAVVDPNIGQLHQRGIANDASRFGELETRIISSNLSPFCWQIHHPVIVLPEVVRGFPPGEQAAILRHERTHIELQHPLHLFLQRLVEAAYWFHPLVWWASQQAAAARELRCDRDSVRTKVEIVDYLRSLLRLVESKVASTSGLPAGIGFVGSTSLLKRRAEQLADLLKQNAVHRQPRRAAAIIVLCTIFCSAFWLPVNPNASRRSAWSPWPTWTAQVLNTAGIIIRDYEVDGHRLVLSNHHR